MTYPRKTATYASSDNQMSQTQLPAAYKAALSSPKTEEAVLGAMIICPKTAIAEALQIFKRINPFYKTEHALIYESLKQMYERSNPVDLYSLSEDLTKRGRIQEAGGLNYLVNISQSVISDAHMEHHCYLLLEYQTKRVLRSLAFDLLEQSSSKEVDIFDTLEQLQKTLDDIDKLLEKREARRYYPLAMEEMEKIAKRKGNVFSGVPSSLDLLNRNVHGWQPSDLIILAARPGMGKSAFALSQGADAAEMGHAVAFFSLEMSKEQLTQRLISSHSGFPLSQIRYSLLADNEQIFIKGAIRDIPLYIDDSPDMDMRQIRIKAKKLAREKGVSFIIVDYLQLIKSKDSKYNSKEQEVSNISRSLKMLAKELNVPIMALSQLSRAVESRGGSKRPQLSDLRDSGAIEQDADIVLFLYRPEYYDHKEWDERYDRSSCIGELELLCEKHRNGGLFYNRIRCDLRTMRFKDIDSQRTLWCEP